ncbi:hypothetical protein EVG20_g10187 [Dentipellis fragilis]|uniref:Uncharacterized protein n=1 Tax=Dentipellis fragilis TaxID=205917 RepID=A0A4Y9XTA6_9AGAM|nr:hypothetical protein EVG20_g10187 [Dentipellis fragilis]
MPSSDRGICGIFSSDPGLRGGAAARHRGGRHGAHVTAIGRDQNAGIHAAARQAQPTFYQMIPPRTRRRNGGALIPHMRAVSQLSTLLRVYEYLRYVSCLCCGILVDARRQAEPLHRDATVLAPQTAHLLHHAPTTFLVLLLVFALVCTLSSYVNLLSSRALSLSCAHALHASLLLSPSSHLRCHLAFAPLPLRAHPLACLAACTVAIAHTLSLSPACPISRDGALATPYAVPRAPSRLHRLSQRWVAASRAASVSPAPSCHLSRCPAHAPLSLPPPLTASRSGSLSGMCHLWCHGCPPCAPPLVHPLHMPTCPSSHHRPHTSPTTRSTLALATHSAPRAGPGSKLQRASLFHIVFSDGLIPRYGLQYLRGRGA